jgi:hypothetical protein
MPSGYGDYALTCLWIAVPSALNAIVCSANSKPAPSSGADRNSAREKRQSPKPSAAIRLSNEKIPFQQIMSANASGPRRNRPENQGNVLISCGPLGFKACFHRKSELEVQVKSAYTQYGRLTDALSKNIFLTALHEPQRGAVLPAIFRTPVRNAPHRQGSYCRCPKSVLIEKLAFLRFFVQRGVRRTIMTFR